MKKVLILLFVVAGLVAAWFWFRSRPVSAAGEEGTAPAAKVETAPLVDQAIIQTIEVFGTVVAAPSGDRVATAPYDSIVRAVHVSVGTPVAAGALLLEVEPSPDAKLALDSARSQLALATKALAATQQRYDLKLATGPDLLTARQNLDDATLKADSFAARGLGGDGRITASDAGVVAKLDLFSGALAPAGTALVTVSTGGKLEARLWIEAADAGAVAAGQAVTVESANRGQTVAVAATIRTVGAALDPVTGSLEARAPVASGASLLLGEHVRAQIQVQMKEHALVVPRSAVLPDGETHALFTLKNGKAVKHEVKLGLATAELFEVIGDGLQPGDLVVTLGNYELEDGMEVQAAEREEKKDEVKEPARSPREAKP